MAEPQTRPAATTATTAPPSAPSSPAAAGGPGERIRSAWQRLAPWPGGKWLFSKLIGWIAPYTGSIGARVEELDAGFCRVSLRERRKLRNPFRSVHAVALMNLAEEASGLATLYALPSGTRGIITALGMEYFKKARGKITAECKTHPPTEVPAEPTPHVAEIKLTDAAGEVVARGEATWMLAPARL